MKKVDGGLVSFGGWRTDPQGLEAEKRYEEFRVAREASTAMRARKTSTHPVRAIGDLFIDRQRIKAEEGEISPRTFGDARAALERFVSIIGTGATVADLTPLRFTAYRARLKEMMGAHAANRHMAIVRQMLRWAAASELIPRVPNFGPDFKRFSPGIRKPRLFTAEEVLRLLEVANPPMRAMILLGINCGYGDTDCAALTFEEIDLDAAVIDTTRHKSRRHHPVHRRCILWPETIQAIREYLPGRPPPAEPALDRTIFLTAHGGRWVVERIKPDERGVPTLINFSSVQLRFRKYAAAAGIRRRDKGDGRSFYTLRRTFRTWADEARDKHAADLIMGHHFGSMGGRYVQGIDDSRLRAVSELVRSRLFGR